MKGYTLVQYGAFTLTGNPNVFTESDNGVFSHGIDIQREQNARSNGSTVVDSQVTEKSIELPITIVTDGNRSATDVFDEFNAALEDTNRYLRFIPTWDDIAPITSSTGWTATGDAENIAYTQTSRRLDASISFDADVSNTGDNFAGVYKTDLAGVDLSSYDEVGNFELMINIPIKDYVTGVTIKVGSDPSNYYSATVTSQADGTPISDGWNLFSIAWSSMTETGTANIALMGKYTLIQVEYTELQVDTTGITFGGLIWQNDGETRNFVCIPDGLEYEPVSGLKTIRKLVARFLCPSGLAESTLQESVYSASNLTGVTNDFTVILGGSYEPKPTISIAYEAATNLYTSQLTNLTNNDSVLVSGDTIASGDSLVFDSFNSSVQLGGESVAFEDVLPRFNIGRNSLRISQNGANDIQQQITRDSYMAAFNGTGAAYCAQSFTPAINGVLTSVELVLKAALNTVYNRSVLLYSNSGGSPNVLIATSSQLSPVLTTDFLTYTVSFNYSLTASTLYWLVLQMNDAFGSTPLQWAINTAGGYAGGSAKKYEGSWAVVTGDAYFIANTVATPTVQFDLSVTAKKYYK